jgi:transposase
MFLEGGRKTSEVARDLGIEPNMLHRWKREMRSSGTEAFKGTGHLSSQNEELREFRLSLYIIQMID